MACALASPLAHSLARRASPAQQRLGACCAVTAISQPLQAAGRCRRRQRRTTSAAGHQRNVVCTSEHWWEDEEEFDALTDAMHPKRVVLVTASSASAGSAEEAALLRAYLQPLEFAQGFSGEETMEFARQLWSGRDKVPYFLKVRSRPALDTCSSSSGDAAAAAASLWTELLQQNWRVQLDAGLGSDAPDSEALLLVCSPDAARQLLAAAGVPASSDSSSSAAGAVFLLDVGGTQAGEPLDWQRLSKRLVLDAVVPSSGDTVAAALSQAGVAAQAR